MGLVASWTPAHSQGSFIPIELNETLYTLLLYLIYNFVLCYQVFCPFAFNPYAAGGKFGQYKIMQKNWKITETLSYGYSSERTQRNLSNEYQHDRV